MAGKVYSIIIVPGDHSGTRQYRVSLRLLWIAGAVLAAFALTILVFMATYASTWREAQRVAGLEEENQSLRQQLVLLNELNDELEDLSALRAQVTAMLGHGIDTDLIEEGMVDLGEVDLALLSLQPERLDHLRAAAIFRRYSPSEWPVAGRVRREFFLAEAEGGEEHPGLSIEAAEGEETLKAAGSGRVVETGHDAIRGDFLTIDHGLNVESYYGGLGNVLVESGQIVDRGQPLAYLGSSRGGESPWLYFEIRVDGKPVDPRRFLRKR
jgi:septal ring factor EnvC (AmiA/AmiB activator)